MCINRLKQKIADIIDRDGITVYDELHEDLKVITAEHTKEIEASNPHDGFKRLFGNNNKGEHHLKIQNQCDGIFCLLNSAFIFIIYQGQPMICFGSHTV